MRRKRLHRDGAELPLEVPQHRPNIAFDYRGAGRIDTKNSAGAVWNGLTRVNSGAAKQSA